MNKYHMVKYKLEITEKAELDRILQEGEYLTLSMCRNKEPYIVALSYGYDADKEEIYFHCAKRGLKLEFFDANPRVCGTVIEDMGYRTGHCDHLFRSVVFWGDVERVDDLDEQKRAYRIMTDQLEADPQAVRDKLLKKDINYDRAFLFKIKLTEIRGKASQHLEA